MCTTIQCFMIENLVKSHAKRSLIYISNCYWLPYTVLARLYAPPFCIVVRRKRRGGGRSIEVCTNAPSLHPPPHATRFPGNSLYCTAHTESRGCHKITIIIVHNSQQLQTRDGRIVGHVPQNWQDFLVHSSVTCRITDVR